MKGYMWKISRVSLSTRKISIKDVVGSKKEGD